MLREQAGVEEIVDWSGHACRAAVADGGKGELVQRAAAAVAQVALHR